MRRLLFLFIRPPRPLWPFNSPASAFWPPLAFASMAAELRSEMPELEVRILDAPALQMGWRTLEAELARLQPAFIGIGEEAVSCVEGLRVAGLGRQAGAWVIAGGCFFGHVAPQALATGLIDVIVHGEGERTLVEVVRALTQSRETLRLVRGISFIEQPRGKPGGQSQPVDEVAVVTTPVRPPIADLDNLPMPAYDLLPVERYGQKSVNHPRLAAIELGRGCFGSCDFCVLWRQMGRFAGDRTLPWLRVKSAGRVMEEIRQLVRLYDRAYLGWVDPCFNAHPERPGQVAELLLRENIRIGQSAWVRTDAVVRDAASGALAHTIAAGLNEVYLGIERPDSGSLESLNKTAGVADARAALSILRSRFPQVLAIGSFIYGLPEDTPKSVRAIHRLALELDLDQFFFIPLTPLPGTMNWTPDMWDPSGERFREFNFLPSGRPHGRYAPLERALLISVITQWPWARIRSSAQQWFCPDARRRRVRRRLYFRGACFHLRRLLTRCGVTRDEFGLVFPSWYEG